MCKWNERREELQSASGASNRQTTPTLQVMEGFSVQVAFKLSPEA